MFDWKIRGELASLARLLAGVAHPAENTGRTVTTAEAVIERLIEERDAWIDVGEETAGGAIRVEAQRDVARADRDQLALALGAERRHRKTDQVIFSGALRDAAAARLVVEAELVEAKREFNAVVDLLVARGVMAEPGDEAHVDLVGVLDAALAPKPLRSDLGRPLPDDR